MSLSHSPNVVINGISVYLDARNTRSYSGTGSTWSDLSGNSRNATLSGSPTFTNGYFDITSDTTYISLSNSGLVPRTGDFTYSVWVNFDSKDALDTIFENGSWPDTFLARFETNQLVIWAENAQRGTFSWNPTTGVWYNMVLVRSAGTLSFYVNGVLTGTPFSMNLDIDLANTNIFLMRSQHTTGQFTDGKISLFSIYSRALSVSEILQNFNALRGRYSV